MCGQTEQAWHDSLPLMSDVADGYEQAVVHAFRCVATAAATGDAAWFAAAHDHCVQAVGARAGGRLVGEVMTLLSALRRERKVPFNVMSPECSRMTVDEECLVAAVRQAGDIPGGVAAAAVHLSGANSAEAACMVSMALDVVGRLSKELRFGKEYNTAGWSAGLMH